MHRSQYNVPTYLSDENPHAAGNSNLFKTLGQVNNSLYEVELIEAQIEHKEPAIVGFFFFLLRKTANVGAVLQLFHHCL